MLTFSRNKPLHFLFQPVHIAPLATFRVLFGAVMFAGMVRFHGKGLGVRPVRKAHLLLYLLRF
jgi:hypothetical protein